VILVLDALRYAPLVRSHHDAMTGCEECSFLCCSQFCSAAKLGSTQPYMHRDICIYPHACMYGKQVYGFCVGTHTSAELLSRVTHAIFVHCE
jgi:hypothetical protein